RPALVIEAMKLLFDGRQIDRLAVAQGELAIRPRRDLSDTRDIDMQEGVGAEMLGHAHLTFPQALARRQLQMFRPDADGGGTELPRRLALQEIHARRAYEAGDEEIL